MSVFQLPAAVCEILDAKTRAFYWSRKERQNLHTLQWQLLCRPRRQGGLHFKHVRRFNQALLLSKYWKFFVDSPSLWVQLLRNKYIPHSRFLSPSGFYRASPFWRGFFFFFALTILASVHVHFARATGCKALLCMLI